MIVLPIDLQLSWQSNRYMAEMLPIWRETLFNLSVNQSWQSGFLPSLRSFHYVLLNKV